MARMNVKSAYAWMRVWDERRLEDCPFAIWHY